MQTTIIGYPRIGKMRELKFAIEKYWRGEITETELKKTAKELREEKLKKQKQEGITWSPVNDFSYYDGILDLSVMLGAIPKRYRELELSSLDTYFAMARGYQGEKGDVKAFAMKKWFNTNYHYMVPELEEGMDIKLQPEKLFLEYDEAKQLGICPRPVTVGAFTFLKLASVTTENLRTEYLVPLKTAFQELLQACNEKGIEWIQIDEPYLVMDLEEADKKLFCDIYQEVLKEKGNVKVLLQTYFGDVRDIYQDLTALPFDGLGLDFVEGKYTQKLIQENGFPNEKYLYAGVVNGKNIWKCDYAKTLAQIEALKKAADKLVLTTSCSLLHVPYTTKSETKLSEDILKYFSYAEEKLSELHELAELSEKGCDGVEDYKNTPEYQKNKDLLSTERGMKDSEVCRRVAELSQKDFIRNIPRTERQKLQREKLGLPLLPTTTIGSFPQTKEVKSNRSRYRKGEITKEQYEEQVFDFIRDCVKQQEELGLDVLVHGEYERNDMVEFFGENFGGYVFTEYAWVQSYGTRCVKPPVIFGDVKRLEPITVKYSQYAASLTEKPMKGMLTGPVTILNWSFPREDISRREMALQIALAIRQEVLDLEAAGISVIQIDEAALREKLPLRKGEWHSDYLDWALEAFRLCHSGVKPETQIHTHMCYSEFDDIIKEIDNMDADVITFEASRSKLEILDALKEAEFETEVGPGVYDIHSPRVPSVEEIVEAIRKMLAKIPKEKLWVNPDCGLKTRGIPETEASLKNMVEAVKIIREEISA